MVISGEVTGKLFKDNRMDKVVVSLFEGEGSVVMLLV